MFISRFVTGFCAAVGVAAAVGAVAAQQKAISETNPSSAPQITSTKFIASAWTLGCQPEANDPKLTCELSQSVVVAKTRARFVRVVVRTSSDKTEPGPYMMVLELPHGLGLVAGAEIQIDNKKAHKLVIYTSDGQGVYARIGLTDKLLSSLQKGSGLKVSFSANTGRKFIVPMSLKGFSAGFNKLKS